MVPLNGEDGRCRSLRDGFQHLVPALGVEIREVGVHTQLQHVVYHSGEENLEDPRGLLDAWVGVDLDEPGVKVLVNDEIVTEELKAPLALLWVDDFPGGQH